MAQFDFILAGGGVSGLALAYELVSSPLNGSSILVVDRQPAERAARTWGFWTDQPTRFDHLVTRRWERVEFVSGGFQRVYDIAPYQYCLVRSSDFFQALRAVLQDAPGVQLLQARVDEVSESKDRGSAQVVIDGVPHGARWAFDSTGSMAEFLTASRRWHDLKHHFKSWDVETPTDRFDPHKVTLFDLRTLQKASLRCFTVQPYTRRSARIIYNVFSAGLLKPNEYDRAIGDYLETVLGIPEYRTGAIETGAVPLTNRPFARRVSQHVMAIGTRGGLVRPSLGSAFPRILRDARAVADSLNNYGDPFHIEPVPGRFGTYGELFLSLIQHQGDYAAQLLTRIFKTRPILDILAFFDESASLSQSSRLVGSIPAAPFLKSIFKVK